jgi:hypothetical protein
VPVVSPAARNLSVKFPAATPTVPTAVGVSVTRSSGIGVSVADGERDCGTAVDADGLSVMAEEVSSCVPVAVSSVVKPDSPVPPADGVALGEGVGLADGVGLTDGVAEVSVATWDCVSPVSFALFASLGDGEAEGEGVADADADGDAEGEGEGVGVGDALGVADALTTGAPVTSIRPSAITTSFAAMPVAGATKALWPPDGVAGAIRQVTVAALLTTGSSGPTKVTFTG